MAVWSPSKRYYSFYLFPGCRWLSTLWPRPFVSYIVSWFLWNLLQYWMIGLTVICLWTPSPVLWHRRSYGPRVCVTFSIKTWLWVAYEAFLISYQYWCLPLALGLFLFHLSPKCYYLASAFWPFCQYCSMYADRWLCSLSGLLCGGCGLSPSFPTLWSLRRRLVRRQCGIVG